MQDIVDLIMIDNDLKDFKNTLLRAHISDNRYPVKGCHVWLPYGYRLKENIFENIEGLVESNGYQKYQFPRLIPGVSMKPVTECIDDFENSLFWLRRKDGTPIDVFLSPTGECAVYTMFKEWINSKRDLPLRIYQRGSIFRYHSNPIAMLNGDERMDLVECHSAFPSKKEAEAEFIRTVETYQEIIDRLGIPVLPLKRPRWGNKPVFVDMVSFETHLPSKKRAFNVAVVYNQDQIFSKPFNVKFSDEDGNRHYTYQITSGISERIVTAMLDFHRDETGIRLLSEFAPEQITVVPVYKGVRNDEVQNYAGKLGEQLGKSYRVNVDTSRENIHPGKKIAASRTRGVPISIGVSHEDIDRRTSRIYVRTRKPPIDCFPIEKLEQEIPAFFKEINQTLRAESEAYLDSQIIYSSHISEARDIVEENKIARFGFCGKTSCIEHLDRELQGELIGSHIYQKERGVCLSCGEETLDTGFYSKRSDSP